ncbi:MAG: sigma 54-interacting transcriptional regulator [Planctomycetaceae bacterium]|jgi:Nif-specific regulatory protein|nr:sigma 54-interacting transcriptional regulator [Planctomycetaceae bacterium]
MQSENAFLVLIQNGEQKELYSLTGQSVTMLGRAAENTVPLTDDRCSRFHAKIFYEEGQWCIQDLGSRNGTYLEEQIIPAQQTIPLQAGNHIQLGHTLFQFGCTELGTTHISPENSDEDMIEHRSGIFGVSETLRGPKPDKSTSTQILHQTAQTAILKSESLKSDSLRSESDSKQGSRITTRTGYGPIELCRLAYYLGKAEEVDQVAKLAIEGLLNATGAEGAGLWLFPYNLNAAQNASDIRLVANATLENLQYNPVSEAIVRTVFEKKEAFLFHESFKGSKTQEDSAKTKVQNDAQNPDAKNTMAAPIRFQSGILGLLHLYTLNESKYLDESDLEYTLAVADTIGVALTHVNKQKELTANLHQARKENTTLREMLQMNSEIIGNSSQIRTIHHLISRAAAAKTSLLIRGESGVGKELIARAVHFASPRKSKPLICLNCAAISESLLASELFGHEKGAFTGATDRKIGKFEAANTGTLFLDEIGEMSQSLQAKFLRVLEGSSFERVGGNTPVSVDVRVIAATNRDLEKEVAEGRFRHDLFFRLRVLEIVVPPLRKRVDDIPILAEYFLDRYCKEIGRKYQGFDPNAMQVLMSYRWPGNIRELKNVVERAVVLGAGTYVQEQDLLLSTLNTTGETDMRRDEPKDVFIPLSLEDMERNHIIRTLEHVQWNKSIASKQLGIERTTLDRKIKRYGLERD